MLTKPLLLCASSKGKQYRVALGKHNLVQNEEQAVFMAPATIIVHEKWSALFIQYRISYLIYSFYLLYFTFY